MIKEFEYKNRKLEGVNWNKIPNFIDKLTWEKLTSQFWLDTRVPVANDISDWRDLTQAEKTLFNKVFGGLTLLDTVQSEIGVSSFMDHAKSKHERAVYTVIEFMESVK